MLVMLMPYERTRDEGSGLWQHRVLREAHHKAARAAERGRTELRTVGGWHTQGRTIVPAPKLCLPAGPLRGRGASLQLDETLTSLCGIKLLHLMGAGAARCRAGRRAGRRTRRRARRRLNDTYIT